MEIKFRVWCKNKNEWEKDLTMITPNGVLVQEQHRHGVMSVSSKTHIVQFFTGLKDKNGKEIYEGDVMIHKNPKPFKDSIYEVVFSSGGFAIEGNGYIEDLNEFLKGSSSAEVIGNIYEDLKMVSI